MTQEEKAKAYDEAIKKAKEALNDGTISSNTISYLQDILPELKESEDERIRKALIEYFNEQCDMSDWNGVYGYQVVAWLERQSKQNLTNKIELKFHEGEWVVNRFGDAWYIDSFDNKNYQVSNGDKYCYFPIEKQNEMHLWTIQDAKDGDVLYSKKHNLLWIYKDSEQCHSCINLNYSNNISIGTDIVIPKDVCPATKEQRDLLNTKIHETGYVWDSESKQLLSLKAEPKFKVGDWVVDKNGIVKQILSYKDGIYKHTNGYSSKIFEDEWRMWTVEDAKDGDVLAYVIDEEDLWIMIYWSLYEPYEGHVHYHALLVNDNFSDKGTCCICINDLKPATKEQRDLLFQKIRESGYEWDAEKKEVRKIEQKPKWSEEDEK